MIELQKDTFSEKTAVENTLIYLISCAVNEAVPEREHLEGIDFPALYQMADRHSLLAMCCMEIELVDGFSFCEDKVLVKRWKEKEQKAVCKIILLDAEREIILSFMEKAGIWYLPLKGVIFKEMYPKFGMRQMADNDILYDKKGQMQLKDFMQSRGYKVEAVGKGNHDIYLKDPVYNFEMHTALYGKLHKEELFQYYQNVEQRMIRNENVKYGYHFSDEDFYVYTLSHAYKHYILGGTGLRSLVDFYIFLKEKEEQLDWEKVKKELAVLHMADFEREVRILCKKMFSKEMSRCTREEEQAIAYYFDSGTYGILEHLVATKYQNIQSASGGHSFKAKWNYYIQRIFPSEEQYRIQSPFAYEHPWVRPFFIIYRIIRGMKRNGKKILFEIKLIHKMK